MRGRVKNPAAQRLEWSAEPRPDRWVGLMRDRWNTARRDDRSLRFRSQLGLPTDRPIVMTGHQPLMVHPGVLAKYIAASAVADTHGAHASFLVVDQDETDPGAIEIPTRREQGALGRRMVRLLDAAPAGVPAGCVPAQGPLRIENDADDWPFIDAGVRRISGALDAHADASSLAEQSALASFELMRDIGIAGAPLLATRLARTDLFRELVGRMRADPLAFVERYNAAVAAHPGARMAPLIMSLAADRYELPLWALAPNSPRRRVYEEELDCAALDTLAPRALFMTLLVRLVGCDLFIHGAGGWVYDRITEQLARDWLGEELAPMTMATATVTLPLLEAPPPSDADVAHAKWLAHHARHDPAMLGDPGAAKNKSRLLREIESLPRRSPQRAAAFRAMHQSLDAARESHADELHRLRDAARHTERAHDSALIAAERSWAFPLYPDSTLAEFGEKVRSAFV